MFLASRIPKSFLIVTLACLISVLLFPLGVQAEELTTGTITVSVVDEVGEGISGNWYLYRGASSSGMLVRNGSFGEKFVMEEGSYFLKIQGTAEKHPYFLLHSENPQFLYAGDSIAFNVQYFETQEQMLLASGNAPDLQSLTIAGTDEREGDIYDENGCNSTRGYVWCARDEMCVRFWSPACRVTEVAGEPVEAAEEQAETVAAVAAQAELADESDEESGVYVPTFDTAPVSAAANDPSEPAATTVASENLRLVQTGSSITFLFIFSVLLSLGVIRRSVFKRNG